MDVEDITSVTKLTVEVQKLTSLKRLKTDKPNKGDCEKRGLWTRVSIKITTRTKIPILPNRKKRL